jgi:hypothetical protein
VRAMPSLEMQTSEMSFHVEAHAGWSKELLESLFDAVEDLRSSLRSINSDLLIWTGHTAEVLLALAHETGAASIIAEEEIEDRWCNIVVSVSTALAVQTPPYHMTRLQQWRASLYNTEVLCSRIALNCSSFMLHPFEHCVNYMLMQKLLGKTRSICSSLTFNRVSYLPLVGYFDIECIGAA